MRRLLFIPLFTLTTVTLYAQTQNPLAGTAWQGQAYVPDETTIILHFKADSVSLFAMPDRILGETMAYFVHADTLTLRKLSGGSPCNSQAVGTLRFMVKTDSMTLTPLTDDCIARMTGWSDKPFQKVAVPVK